MEKKNYRFGVEGLRCQSCVALIEEKISAAGGVVSVKVSLSRQQAELVGDLGDDHEKIISELSALIESHGYRLSLQPIQPKISWQEFSIALPLAAILLAGFWGLQKSGWLDFFSGAGVNYGTALLVGLIASVSTCLAVVGGLILSLSASHARNNGSQRLPLLFHFGRLIGFFALGGLIGLLGKFWQLDPISNLVLNGVVFAVMVILGINLLDVFPVLKNWQPRLPKIFSRGISAANQKVSWVGAFLIGVATFFLPCGFTQSMQLFALTTGSFWQGGLTMLVFALGTLPVLALLSFGSLSLAQSPKRGLFFKTAGLIVVVLAIFNFLNVLAANGFIPPIFNL
ncbi:MAG: sulfite exporter TauE/SafE family protein [bacterium]|nr:sulfite exporter TauE/SafE family protein [bacterium]